MLRLLIRPLSKGLNSDVQCLPQSLVEFFCFSIWFCGFCLFALFLIIVALCLLWGFIFDVPALLLQLFGDRAYGPTVLSAQSLSLLR